jgi:hypothetical protein
MMRRRTLGKWILTFVLVAGAVVATAVDWNTTHLFNPAWHPHARFHDALFLLFLDATTLIVLWLLWRPSREPGLGIKVAALYSLAAWTPFFYIEPLIPGTSLLAADNVPVLKIGGMSFAPNLIVAALLVLLTVIAYGLARDASSDA